MRSRLFRAAAGAVLLGVLAGPGSAQHGHGAGGAGPAAPAADRRVPVRFPEPLKAQTLANMRDHLLALQQIQEALGSGAYDRAAELAERRLGMSSLPLHGAHEVAQHMPPQMQAAGTSMHRSASRFAIASRDAAVTGDVRSALSALADMTGACVACHAGFRLE